MQLDHNADRILQQVRQYRNQIDSIARQIINALISEGEIIARSEIISLNAVYTGALANSISHFYDAATHTGFIRCNADYGIFVEFGTGIVGSQSPHPGQVVAEVGYRYGGGTTYVQLEDGRVGWYYPGADGKWHFTEGQPSRPFMYNTARILSRQIATVGKQVFSNN